MTDNESTLEDLRNAEAANRRHRARMTRTTNPRDPDYIEPPTYAIQSTTEPALRWSNADGWTNGQDFDTYSEDDTETLNLPIGGEWMTL